MKKIIKKIVIKIFDIFFSKKYSELYQIVDKYNYISFDIFDTLIKRNVKNPTDLFTIIEIKYQIKDFKNKRIKAEKDAYLKSNLEEITIDDIYNELNIENKEKVKKIEISIEKQFCIQNKPIYELYKYCLEKNKKIFFTSDMYLDELIIKEILNNANYKKYNLYLSSKELLKKRSGNLFKKILDDNKIKEHELLHIGDSFIGDYLKPKSLKIKSVLIKRVQKNTLFTTKNKDLDYNILSSFLNNNQYQNDIYEHLGYEVLGPILYDFTTWLHNQIKEAKINKIFFLARDAKIIMDVYKKRFKENIPICYLKVSRKSMLQASLKNVNNLDDVLEIYKSIIKNTSTVSDLFNTLNLKKESNLDNKLLMDLSFNNKKNIFNLIKEDIINESKKQSQYLKEYLKQNGMEGKTALVDIGWNGTIQYHLKNFTSSYISGYYYGINKDEKYKDYKKINRKGYLFNYDKFIEEQIIVSLNIGLFETMFLSSEGSTIKYIDTGKKIEAICQENEYSKENLKDIKQIQNSALKFIDDVENSEIKEYISNFNSKVYFENFKNLTISPKLKNIKYFKNIQFQNFNKRKLIDNKNILYYLFHPKKFYKDFMNSYCKVFFMKNVFKINLPYYKILKKLYIKKTIRK